MNLPFLDANYTFNKECLYKDEDESNNIKNAIDNSEILLKDISNIFNINEEELIQDDKLKNYDALIDVCGYYFNILNYKIALKIHKILDSSRDVIFIDEKDEKMVIKNGKLEKINEYIKYKNPFFYYDQAHTVGIDIKQDNYPILHGLCIVDQLSYYSEIAQAMFRLRKLNLGHKISFVLNNFSVSNNSELYCKFRQNESNLIEKQKDSLNLQALKSDIRKKRQPIRCNFMENYKEKVFYYFNNNFLKEDEALDLIFTKDEIDNIELDKYNLNKKIIKNMIYNLDFITQNSEVQYQISNQQNTETEIQTKTQIQSQIQSQILIDKSLKFANRFEKYKFKNFDFMKTIDALSNYNKYTFKLNDLLSFLPNIFISNYSSVIFCTYAEKSDEIIQNKDFIFIYLDKIEKFILAPKYMVSYLYNDFLMYDLNINIINQSLSTTITTNRQKEIELEDSIFTKIITYNYTPDDFKTLEDNLKIIPFNEITISYYLSAFILYYRFAVNNLNDNQIGSLLIYFDKYLNDIISTLDFNNHNELIRKVQIIDFHKKYLKYKTKYLEIKELLGIN